MAQCALGSVKSSRAAWHIFEGKGSGDYWVISWLCRVSSIDFEWTLMTWSHAIGPISLIYVNDWMMWHYFTVLSKIKTAVSAQPKKLLNSHQTLFLMRGWGLSMRLFCCCYGTLPSAMPIILQTSVFLFQSWCMAIPGNSMVLHAMELPVMWQSFMCHMMSCCDILCQDTA